MWPYWMMFLIPAIGVLMPWRLKASQAWLPWAMVGVLFAAMIGFRHEVGGDWYNYLSQFWTYGRMSWLDAIRVGKDPGYYGLIPLISAVGGDMHVLNFVCAIPLVVGTVALARKQPFPWLALLAAVPYLLLIVGMGYTRQAVAIGFAMLGLVALAGQRRLGFVIWVLIAATFHKSAVLLLPIAALAAAKNKTLTYTWVGITTLIGMWLFVYDSADELVQNYVVSSYADASQGAAIRVAMNAVPSLFILIFRQRLFPLVAERRLWIWMAIISLLCVPLLQVSATAVDRIALYFIPLQLVAFSRFPYIVRSQRARTFVVLAIIGYYAAVQFTWLNFADHADAWLPYQFMPIGGA